MMRSLALLLLAAFTRQGLAFVPVHHANLAAPTKPTCRSSSTHLSVADLNTVALVAGQENYGLAVVSMGEALWSFLAAPSMGQIKVLLPGVLAAVVLFAVSGPMITSGVAASVSTGLTIATLVSVGLGVSYVLRMLAPFSESPKEIAFLGLLVSLAGFFSFSQNLVVDGFVTLPELPSLPPLPTTDWDDDGFVIPK